MVHSVIIIMTIDLHELAAGLGFSQLGEESSPSVFILSLMSHSPINHAEETYFSRTYISLAAKEGQAEVRHHGIFHSCG
jgi:hypothetical protein